MVKLEINLDRIRRASPYYTSLPNSEYRITVENINVVPDRPTFVTDWRYVNLSIFSKERIAELVKDGILKVYHNSYPLNQEEVLTYDFDEASTGSGIFVGDTPPDFPSTGNQWFDTTNNIIYSYNGTEWISSEKIQINFSKKDNATSLFLRTGAGDGLSTGHLILMNAQIRYISAFASDGDQTKSFIILSNDTPIFTFSLSTLKYINSNVNINLTSGNILQCFCTSGNVVVNPSVDIILSWRK